MLSEPCLAKKKRKEVGDIALYPASSSCSEMHYGHKGGTNKGGTCPSN